MHTVLSIMICTFVQVFIGLRSSLIKETARQAKNPNALAILYNESATGDFFTRQDHSQKLPSSQS